eukprot:1599820-Prymnesium_polylepis.2
MSERDPSESGAGGHRGGAGVATDTCAAVLGRLGRGATAGRRASRARAAGGARGGRTLRVIVKDHRQVCEAAGLAPRTDFTSAEQPRRALPTPKKQRPAQKQPGAWREAGQGRETGERTDK